MGLAGGVFCGGCGVNLQGRLWSFNSKGALEILNRMRYKFLIDYLKL
jgi:hypothetical protein